MTLDFDSLPLTGWYPGHMLKAGRQIQAALKLVDVVVELVDARLPRASRNPEFKPSICGRPLCLLANKSDLADPGANRQWEARLRAEGEEVRFASASTRASAGTLARWWRQVALAARRSRGATRELNRPLRIMIAGVPNVGKSTLVNALHESRRAPVGPKPGVTRQTQWVPLRGGLELLDTPGVLWPRITSKTHELKLALAGVIRDEVVGIELIAEFLCVKLLERGGADLSAYGLAEAPTEPRALIEAVARRRGCLRSGGGIDAERAAAALLKDFRAGRLGRLTLELPEGA